jgi:choline dehydrogenase-like flavoprotein
MTDVVIVGSGIAGVLIAKKLAIAGKDVMILEAGDPVPPNINDYMERFYKSADKVPESPYTPEVVDKEGHFPNPANVKAGRMNTKTLFGSADSKTPNWKNPDVSYAVQTGNRPFASTYERSGGGTCLHWLGTSLRLLPSDFEMANRYGSNAPGAPKWVNWPINYDALQGWYEQAEHEIGVSANKSDQAYLELKFNPNYQYLMPGIPLSRVDQAVSRALPNLKPEKLAGLKLDPATKLAVRSTPAARNSQPTPTGRRACAGNTNCIPICPIQAKYDPTITLNEALTLGKGRVRIMYRTVAKDVVVGGNGNVTEIKYLKYTPDGAPPTEGSISAKIYVIAANAIETPRLLMMSNGRKGIANSSNLVGRNLMDHPFYVAWAQTPQPIYPYRGPLSTAGMEDLRDGRTFRSERAAFRMEIGNEGWNFVIPGGDPNVTTLDFVNGVNLTGANGNKQALLGPALANALNRTISSQLRIGFLIEQTPDDWNLVKLSDSHTDGLGLPRPEIKYDLSPYTRRGLAAAKQFASAVFDAMGATEMTFPPDEKDPFTLDVDFNGKPTKVNYGGAGHIMGTYRMGADKSKGVVNANQQSFDHSNLYLVGSGTFPTTGTANPTLTIAALCLRTADHIVRVALK